MQLHIMSSLQSSLFQKLTLWYFWHKCTVCSSILWRTKPIAAFIVSPPPNLQLWRVATGSVSERVLHSIAGLVAEWAELIRYLSLCQSSLSSLFIPPPPSLPSLSPSRTGRGGGGSTKRAPKTRTERGKQKVSNVPLRQQRLFLNGIWATDSSDWDRWTWCRRMEKCNRRRLRNGNAHRTLWCTTDHVRGRTVDPHTRRQWVAATVQQQRYTVGLLKTLATVVQVFLLTT